ncbi:MAG: ATP-binding protein [Almyronema sp.]
MDIGKILTYKSDIIIQEWIENIREDSIVTSDQKLSYQAVRNSIPLLLEALASILSQSEENEITLLKEKAIEHGILRAKQGFNAEELMREYGILRQTIFSNLEAEIFQLSTAQAIRFFRLIDLAIDRVIGRCFKSYTAELLDDLEQVKSQLLLTNQELNRLVIAQQENTSRLAHELKNPLNSIIGYSDLILRRNKFNPDSDNHNYDLKQIERVLRNARNLLRIINDALEISRYKAGKIKLKPLFVDLPKLVDGVIDVLEPLANEKNLPLVKHYSLERAGIVTDSLRLQQVLTNLISNAIRYTKTGKIEITCCSQAEGIEIAIADTGIGIAAADQAHIFEPFYQSSYSARLPDSTGLGLTIVANIVELLQGKIQFKSEVDVGTTFRLWLPTAIAAEESTELSA